MEDVNYTSSVITLNMSKLNISIKRQRLALVNVFKKVKPVAVYKKHTLDSKM